MRLLTFLLGAALLVPAFGQSVYKCPQPDGKVSYQAARCPSGNRMSVQDNGKASGEVQSSGIRPSEQAILDSAKQRDDAQRAVAVEAQRKAIPPPARQTNVYDMLNNTERESSETIRSLTRMLGR